MTNLNHVCRRINVDASDVLNLNNSPRLRLGLERGLNVESEGRDNEKRDMCANSTVMNTKPKRTCKGPNVTLNEHENPKKHTALRLREYCQKPN